jgi:hypothetical protein
MVEHESLFILFNLGTFFSNSVFVHYFLLFVGTGVVELRVSPLLVGVLPLESASPFCDGYF